MTASDHGAIPGLDATLLDPTRLAIMSVLSTVDWCDFGFLRDAVALSDSALSKHLTRLRAEGCVEQRRTYHGRVPKTRARATDLGVERFRAHVHALQWIVENTPRRGLGATRVAPGAV